MYPLAWLSLPALALLLLGAHFVHAGLWPVAVVCVAMIGLLAVRRRWAARVVQTALAIGTIEWLLTAWTLARLRVAHGMPYVRLLLILAVVAGVTAAAALVFERAAIRRHFGRSAGGS